MTGRFMLPGQGEFVSGVDNVDQAENGDLAAMVPVPDARPLVLVVDDRIMNRQYVSLVLKEHCRIKEAEDGEVALRLARDADMPDLVLLDLTMPRVDGKEVLRLLRADPGTRDIPVIVLTGDGREEIETACLELGADDFLVRPFRSNALLLRARNLLERRRLQLDLAASITRARALFLSSPFPILIVEGGRIVDCNQAATAMFGYDSKQEMLNLHPGQLSPERQPDGEPSLAKAERMMAQVLDQGTHQYEWVHRRKDGSEVLAEITPATIRVDGHTIIYGHMRDITEAKANVATIRNDREQQTLLRALLEDGFSETPLATILKRGLERLLSLSWLSILPKGGVFLAQGPGKPVRLVAEHNLAPQLQSLCAQVPQGHCLCGRAAATRQMQYARCVDQRHETTYPGIEDHGHYSLPLMAGDELVGVLVLYLPIGFKREETKEEFLRAVCNVLAAIIRRKQGLQELREREELYRNVVETSLDGFFMTNSEGRVLEANASYQRLSGYSHEELTDLHFMDLEASENADEVAAHIVQIVQKGADLFETRHRTKDGRNWPVEMSVSYLPFDGGRFFAFARDIGPREEMRQSLLRSQHNLEEQVAVRTAELEASRQQLASIIDNLPAVLYIKDLDGRYLSVNRCHVREIGFPKERVIGATDWDLFPAAMARRFSEVDRQALISGQPITLEESVLTHSGLKHDYLTTKLPLLDAQGDAYAVLGIAVDITQIKTLQAQLSRAQALAHLGSWRLDIASGEMECSEETYRIFELEQGTPVSLDRFLALLEPEDREAKRLAWAAALRGEPYDVEFRIRTDKRTLWVREQAHLKFSETGIPILAEGSVQDVTEIELAREALENAASEAHRVARVKSEFLANMSHEIRTPLNGILGLAQVGQRQNVGRQSQRLFDQILDSGQLLLGIVNDILDFSKIEAGKLRVETVDVQLDHLVQHVSVMCSDRASAKGFLLRIERAADLPAWFKGDPLRIAQILVNLVGNAIKFTEQGEVVLNIASAAGQIVFTVRDTGIGISEEQLANLFTPFEQADGSTTRRFGGTGLGLAITHRLVALMQGDIQVRSTPGVGSSFIVRLPLTASPCPGQPEDFALPGKQMAGAQRLAGLHLLAAEDNVVNRMVLEDMLVLEGAILLCAENGQEALEIVQRDGEAAWDLVLTDIHMPIMNGHQLAQALRLIAPGLPVIGVTAHAMVEEQQRCLDSGMVAHVAKPIVMDDLVKAVLRHARPRPGSAPGTGTAGHAGQMATPQGTGQAPAAVSTDPADRYLDRAALLSHHRGRADFIEKLLGMVVKSHSTTPARLRAAATARDSKELAFVAHSFAGVAASVLAKSLHAAAKEVELQARAEAPVALGQALVLADEVEAFLDALDRSLKPS